MLMLHDGRLRALAGRLEGKRCLVTGATGMLGRNLVPLLAAAGAQVHVTSHRRAAATVFFRERIEAHSCDLADRENVDALFGAVRPEFVFHLATARGDPHRYRDRYIGTNVLGADNLVRAATKQKVLRLVVAGSSLEYGPHPYAMDEAVVPKPDTLHGVTRAAGTLLFREAALSAALPVVVLRLFSVFGYWEPSRRLIPSAMRAALNGHRLPMTGYGFRRDFVFVSDVIEALLLGALAENVDGGLFNIGTGIQTGNHEVVDLIEAVSGRPVERDIGAYVPHATDTEFWCADASRAAAELQWRPRHTLREGIEKMWRWYVETPDRYSGAAT